MIYNVIKILILILVLSFFSMVFNYYYSAKKINLVEENRSNINNRMFKDIPGLEVLPNDTNDVIKFNSGFDNSNKKNFKRNFWELFK